MSAADARPGRLDVGVVGTGRVGAVLGAALVRAGHRVVAASGSSDASRSRLETLLPHAVHGDPDEVVRAAELVLLTVPDDALTPLTEGLAALGVFRPGQVVVHCAGRHGTEALAAAAAAGAITLAIHPAMTFTGTSLDLSRLQDATFAVSAPAAFLPIAQALVVEMGGEPLVVANEDRPAYHAALTHAANHTVTLVTQASAALARIGVEEPGRVLGPLVHASVEGALRDAPGAVTSLTGPVVRGDVATVAAHLAALAPYPEMRAAYRALAQATADLALGAGRIGPSDYAGLLVTLGVE